MAMELAQESAYTAEELEAYDEYLDAIRVAGTVRADSFEEGREEGREEGEQKRAEAIARKALAKGMSIKEVSELTGLSVDAIQSLKP